MIAGQKPEAQIRAFMKQKIPRTSLRYSVNLEVLEVNDRRVTETSLRDISTTGFSIEAPSLHSARGTLKVKIHLPAGQNEFNLAGQVVWARPVAQKPGRFMMGVKFFKPLWEIESLLRLWRSEKPSGWLGPFQLK